jgi:hypothetical protein
LTTPVLLLKYIRHRLRRAAAYFRHGPGLRTAPILFANAIPKSGTHLLVQILKACTRIGPAVDSGLPAVATFAGESGARRSTPNILHDLDRLRPGDVSFGHLHACPEFAGFFKQRNAAVFFLYRDPRDVVISHVHYVTEIETRHVHHPYYAGLPDFNTRLNTSILGRPELDGLFPDIRARFVPYLRWLTTPAVLLLRFEDLIENRKSKVTEIVTFMETFGFTFSTGRSEAVDCLLRAVDPQHSPTFRTGTAGGWRTHFTAGHKALFKEVAGELLIDLGYERDLSW